MTLVLTTHYMDEAEQLCDRLVVMDKAKIVAEGSPRQLIEQLLDARGARSCGSGPGVQETLDGQLDGLADRVEQLPDRCSSTPPTARPPPPRSTSAGSSPRRSLVRRSTLEDVFLRLTGRTLIE